MYIEEFEDCCAFKIAANWWDVDEEDLEEVCQRVLTHKERNALITKYEREEFGLVDYGPGSGAVNNHVLAAIVPAQRVFFNKFKRYVKEHKKPVAIELLTKIRNPKTGNLVYLYMIKRKEDGPQAKKSAA